MCSMLWILVIPSQTVTFGKATASHRWNSGIFHVRIVSAIFGSVAIRHAKTKSARNVCKQSRVSDTLCCYVFVSALFTFFGYLHFFAPVTPCLLDFFQSTVMKLHRSTLFEEMLMHWLRVTWRKLDLLIRIENEREKYFDWHLEFC